MQYFNFEDICEENKEFEYLFSKIKSIILNSNNASLSYYSNKALINDLSTIVTEMIINVSDKENIISNIKKIISDYDYRVLADYIKHVNLFRNTSLFDFSNKEKSQLLDHNISCNSASTFEKSDIPAIQKDSLSELFCESGKDSYFYVKNTLGKHIIDNLIKDSKGNIASYIELQKDLAGMFSLVRKGLIKKIQLSDGKYIITKRNNPEKVGKFENEQKIISEISKRLNFCDNNKIKCDDFYLSLINSLAIIGVPNCSAYYSVMMYQPGRTLEEILLSEKGSKTRQFHFKNIHNILEILYSKGIIWTDMAPRNIIVDETGEIPTYYILDFEKSKLLSSPASPKEKEEHLRGPVCVEEFGAIFSLDELKQIFDFNPDNWDFSSEKPVPFAKPKRELLAIFKGRNQHNFTFGQYNKLEREILKVRLPIIRDHQIFYPLHCSFKVDHYLGADYDRKLTEIFLSSCKFKLFISVIKVIQDLLELLENSIITSEFISMCRNEFETLNSPTNKLMEKLKNSIDRLYELKDNKELFSEFVFKLDLKRTFFKNYTECFSIFNGTSVCKKNFSSVETKISNIFEHINYSNNIEMIFLSGGYGRGEITSSSDIDIAVIGNNTTDTQKNINNKIDSILGMDVEYYPFSNKNIKEYVINNPQYLIDIAKCKLIYATKSSSNHLKDIVEELSNDQNFLRKLIDTYLKYLGKKDYLKFLLESINVLLYLFKKNIDESFYDILTYYKNILISNKLHKYYHYRDFVFYPAQLEMIHRDIVIFLNTLKENLI